MQNNKPKGFREFLKGKGYYIVLLLCAVTVGVSGYFLLRGREPAEPIQSSEIESDSHAPSVSTAPKTPDAADVIATQDVVESSSTEPAKMEVLRPVDGEDIFSFAADHLAYHPTTRDWRTHEGTDYGAAVGTPVLAAADGSVYTIYEDESYGMTVVLRHADGYTTHYANLSEDVCVSVGQSVKAGDVLGTVGQTACVETAAEPHLHFAVYLNNVPVDPEEFLNN